MGDPDRISRDDWETIVHAPFHLYHHVASADGAPTEAQFRRLVEELNDARTLFGDGSIGATMVEALAGNLDALWATWQSTGRSAKDGLKRLKKALREAPEAESVAIRDWLLVLGVRIGQARREMAGPPVSDPEVAALRDAAGWLDRPIPAISAE